MLQLIKFGRIKNKVIYILNIIDGIENNNNLLKYRHNVKKY